MKFISRLFAPQDVREALQAITKIEQSFPENALGLRLGFDVIKDNLRKEITDKPEELRTAMQNTGYPIDALVVIRARNLVCDQLESGMHMLLAGYAHSTAMTMSGDGLRSLHGHLTNLLEKDRIETKEEAAESRKYLREMIQQRFG